MSLKLKRPLVFFDLETTGVSVTNDYIVEMSFIKVFPDGRKEIKTKRVKPLIPIPEEATAVHHITDDDVKDEPVFKQYAKSLAEWLKGCDLAGFNSNHFDVPLLLEEFKRAGVPFSLDGICLVDAYDIYRMKEKRNLESAYKYYCNKTLEGAHQASADIQATMEVLLAQVEKYEDFHDATVETLAEFTSSDSLDLMNRIVKNSKGEAVFNFGKYKGKLVKEVFKQDRNYYAWIMNGDFSKSTKDVVARIKSEMDKNENC